MNLSIYFINNLKAFWNKFHRRFCFGICTEVHPGVFSDIHPRFPSERSLRILPAILPENQSGILLRVSRVFQEFLTEFFQVFLQTFRNFSINKEIIKKNLLRMRIVIQLQRLIFDQSYLPLCSFKNTFCGHSVKHYCYYAFPVTSSKKKTFLISWKN